MRDFCQKAAGRSVRSLPWRGAGTVIAPAPGLLALLLEPGQARFHLQLVFALVEAGELVLE